MFGRSKNGASSNVEAMAAAISRSQAVIEFRTDGTIVTANENFLRLQDELADLENKIAAARRFLNNAVAEYNSAIQQFPAVVIAGPMGFTPAEMFTLDDAERAETKNAPKVSFS